MRCRKKNNVAIVLPPVFVSVFRLFAIVILYGLLSSNIVFRRYELLGVVFALTCAPRAAGAFSLWLISGALLLHGFPEIWWTRAVCLGAGLSLAYPAAWGGWLRINGAWADPWERVPRARRTLLWAAMFAALSGLIFRATPLGLGLCWTGVWVGALLFAPKAPAVAWRQVWPNLALAAFSVLLSIGVLEAGVRILFRNLVPVSKDFRMMHPRAGFTLCPNAQDFLPRPLPNGKWHKVPIEISSQGLRDRVFDSPEEGEFRVVMLGDSFTFGWGLELEKGMVKVLEKRLWDAGYTHVSVINGGVGNYGPWQERIFLEERCLPLKPNLVLHQLFPCNDIENTLSRFNEFPEAYNEPAQRDLLRWRSANRPPVCLEFWVKNHSAAYRILSRRLGYGEALTRVLYGIRGCNPTPPYVLPADNLRNFAVELLLKQWYPALEKGWSEFERDVLEIKTVCARHGAQYAAFCLPEMIEVCPQQWDWVTSGNPPDTYERFKDIRLCEAFFERESIPYVSVQAAMEMSPDREDLYIPNDGHLTEKGVAVVTDQLCRFLVEHYLTPTAIMPDAAAARPGS